MHQLLVAPADGSEQGDGSERGDESYQGDGSGHDLEAGTIPYGSYWSAQEYRYPRVSWARRSWSMRRRAQEGGGEQEGGEQEGGSALPSWLSWRGDFIDNRLEVLGLLARHTHVRLSLHGHVHANTLTTRHGVAFVTGAAASEYPMQVRLG